MSELLVRLSFFTPMPQQQKSNPFKNIRALHSGENDQGRELESPEASVEQPPRQIDGSTDIRTDGLKQARSNKPGYQKLTVYIPDALYRKLKVQAATDDRDLYAIAEEAFEFWFRKRSG